MSRERIGWMRAGALLVAGLGLGQLFPFGRQGSFAPSPSRMRNDLAKEEQGEFKQVMGDMELPAGAPAEALAERSIDSFAKDEAPMKKAKAMGSLGARGYGAGGGGLGGIGAVGSASPAAPSVRMNTIQVIKGSADKKEGAQKADGEGSMGVEAAPTRAWFPESFVFQPLVETGSDGLASIEVPVPDRLTTWRLLALAHDRAGHQGGAETEFLGTLPAYVDPVVPPFLVVGDEVRLPVQVVNTTERDLSEPLQVSALGARVAGGSRDFRVAGGLSMTSWATLTAPTIGSATIEARYGTTDAVSRTIPVVAAGKPWSTGQGGTLAGPRTFAFTPPAELLPDGVRLRATVIPGALGILQSELDHAPDRGTLWDDAHALMLAGVGGNLMAKLGAPVDPEVMRTTALIAGQRLIRAMRRPDALQAAPVVRSALAHPGNPLLAALGSRLASQLAREQRPDGTFLGGNGWPLQRVVAATAECTRAVLGDESSVAAKQQAIRVGLRAGGAFERHLGHIDDGYTAGLVVISGAVSGDLKKQLQAKVREAVKQEADGSRSLSVDAEVTRGDGTRPSLAETTAVAVLALADDELATWKADLGGTLLSAYSPESGWGEGRTNLLALQAVQSLFAAPLPAEVKVVLELDGKEVGSGVLSGEGLRRPLQLDVALPAQTPGEHRMAIRSEPAVSGLAYRATFAGQVPWPTQRGGGLELELTPPRAAEVGKNVGLGIAVVGPANRAIELRIGLPAGVQPDAAKLDGLVRSGLLRSHREESGAVVLALAPLHPGQRFEAELPVSPTLAGSLQSLPSWARMEDADDQRAEVAPQRWTIR